MKIQPSTDFVICGGGLVGALLALLLAKRGYPVALIERRKASLPQAISPLDTRALALNYGTLTLFKDWGFADLIQNAQFIKNIHVSDKGHTGIVHIKANEEGLPYLGAVIPFEQLVFSLQQEVARTPLISFIEDEITHFAEQNNTVKIALKNHDSITGSILIGADGGDSFVRKALGIHFTEYDYQAQAIIGKVRVHKQVSDYAFERFTHHGPIALLPAENCLYTMVWVQQQNSNLDQKNLLPALQHIFGYRAGIFVAQGMMRAYPLKRLEAKQTHAGRIGLFGNAAHLLHPVAGQGFNLAVRDILTFLEILDMNKSLDADLWMEYDKRARFQQKTIKMLTHTFVKGFESQRSIISAGRNILLQLFEWNQTGRTFLNDLMVGRY